MPQYIVVVRGKVSTKKKEKYEGMLKSMDEKIDTLHLKQLL